MSKAHSTDPLADLLSGARPEADEGAERALPRLLNSLREHLGMDVAFVAEFTAGERVFRFVDAADGVKPPLVGHGDPRDETYCQRIADGRLTGLIPDTGAEPQTCALAVTHELGIGAYLGVPIILGDGELYGTLCCFSRFANGSLNDRDLAVLRVVADVASGLIEQDLLRHREAQQIARDVGQALDEHGMSMVYQPILDLASCETVGFEALARFRDGDREVEGRFLDAGRIGRGIDLELHAVALALDGLERLSSDCYLSINVSAEALVSDRLRALLRATPLERVVFEVTEHNPVARYDELLAALSAYRARGARLAVDDAGAGYASFRHILLLAPDLIKLDRTLVSRMDVEASRRELACALIQFANKTGSILVAEGVETAEELAALRTMGVRLGQGFYLGRPASLDALLG